MPSSGIPLIGMELKRDNTILFSGNFLTTAYVDDDSKLERSKSYSYRFRVKNANLWSDWSDVTVMTAASVPSPLGRITVMSASSS